MVAKCLKLAREGSFALSLRERETKRGGIKRSESRASEKYETRRALAA